MTSSVAVLEAAIWVK